MAALLARLDDREEARADAREGAGGGCFLLAAKWLRSLMSPDAGLPVRREMLHNWHRWDLTNGEVN